MKREKGFNLPELLTAMAIVGVLAAIAVGPLMDIIRGGQVKDAAHQLYASIIYARGEAVKRNTCVNVTPVNTADWTEGWAVQLPTDASGTPTCGGTGTPEVVRRYTVQGDVTVAGPAASVSLTGTGRLSTLGDTSSTSLCNNSCSATCSVNASPPSFRVALSSTSVLRCVSVRSSGAPEIKKGTS